ncbi:MAG: hypothetical protein MMC23_002246 [Stictis urceolatum]|nr:hypothetical protein [Stictis urceolata]
MAAPGDVQKALELLITTPSEVLQSHHPKLVELMAKLQPAIISNASTSNVPPAIAAEVLVPLESGAQSRLNTESGPVTISQHVTGLLKVLGSQRKSG